MRISDWSSDVCSSDLDKAIDVIDEVGAMQMLVAPSKRKKTITAKEIEAVIATMARIPPKSVSSDDKATLASLETDLKRVVFGQNTARSEERREGKGCGSTCRARGAPYA